MTKQERQKERLDARAFKARPPGRAPGPAAGRCRRVRCMKRGCYGRSARVLRAAAAHARRACVCPGPCALTVALRLSLSR